MSVAHAISVHRSGPWQPRGGGNSSPHGGGDGESVGSHDRNAIPGVGKGRARRCLTLSPMASCPRGTESPSRQDRRSNFGRRWQDRKRSLSSKDPDGPSASARSGSRDIAISRDWPGGESSALAAFELEHQIATDASVTGVKKRERRPHTGKKVEHAREAWFGGRVRWLGPH